MTVCLLFYSHLSKGGTFLPEVILRGKYSIDEHTNPEVAHFVKFIKFPTQTIIYPAWSFVPLWYFGLMHFLHLNKVIFFINNCINVLLLNLNTAINGKNQTKQIKKYISLSLSLTDKYLHYLHLLLKISLTMIFLD